MCIAGDDGSGVDSVSVLRDYENVVYGVLLLVGLVGCFVCGYVECVQIVMAGLIGAYTGNKLGSQ